MNSFLLFSTPAAWIPLLSAFLLLLLALFLKRARMLLCPLSALSLLFAVIVLLVAGALLNEILVYTLFFAILSLFFLEKGDNK